MKKVALIVLAMATALAGCASFERTALTQDNKKKIKTLAVVSSKEPEKYFLYPGQAPGGFALYMFGALGGLVLGGIEATRFESATTEFTNSVKPKDPAVAALWNETLLSRP